MKSGKYLFLVSVRQLFLASVTLSLVVASVSTVLAYPRSREVVARVGRVSIYSNDLAEHLQQKIAATSYHRAPSPAKRAELEKDALEELINNQLLFLESKRRNIKVAKADIEKILEQQTNRYGGKAAFKKLLKKKGRSLDEFRQAISVSAAIQKLLAESIDSNARVGEKEAKAYFDANRDSYILPASYHVKHILVPVRPFLSEEERSKAKKLANDLAGELRQGLRFEELKEKYTNARFTDFGYVHKGSIIPQMEKVVEKLGPGEVSEPVKTVQGYQICKLVAKKDPIPLSFEKVSEAVTQERTKIRREELLVKLLKTCRKRWPVEIVRQAGKRP